MIKKLLRGIALVLLIGMLGASLVACSDDEGEYIPEGMQIANCAGDDFRLYVPTSWNLNNSYGVAGAYYNASVQSTVSVVKYPVTEEMKAALPEGGDATKNAARLDAFAELYCKASIASQAVGEVLVEENDLSISLLDDVTAHQYHYYATVKGENLHFLQVIGERGGAFYVFTFTCSPDLYENLLTDVEKMLTEFIFADPYNPDDYARAPGEEAAPEGMILVSNKDVAYRFYAPDTWKTNYDQQIFAAYREDDRSSVSVVPYMPQKEGMSVAEYFSICKNQMLEIGGEDSLVMISEEEVKLGGRNATEYVYTYVIGGKTYQYKQIIAVYRSMVYSMTYTATPENFHKHLADVDAMIDAFEFR